MSTSRGVLDYDQALKRLLLRAHNGFLALIAPGVTFRGELSPELPAAGRQADLVWEVERPDGGYGALHIELQTKSDAEIGERLAEYAIRPWRRDHLPVYSIVVYLRPSEHLPQSPFVVDWMGSERLRYAYDVIRLWEIPADRILASANVALWTLAGLLAGASVDSTIGVARQIVSAPLPQAEQSELTEPLITLASVRLPRRQLLSAGRRYPMIDEIIRESGLAEEFREEGMRDILRSVLEGRHGPLSQDIVAALNAADAERLREIARHAGTDSLDELRARLGLA